MAMELVPGEDLAARLERGALPVSEALALCRGVAEGLVTIAVVGAKTSAGSRVVALLATTAVAVIVTAWATRRRQSAPTWEPAPRLLRRRPADGASRSARGPDLEALHPSPASPRSPTTVLGQRSGTDPTAAGAGPGRGPERRRGATGEAPGDPFRRPQAPAAPRDHAAS